MHIGLKPDTSGPALIIARAAKILGVTFLSGRHNIEKLVDAGILKEATGRKRNRVYIAPGILNILAAR